MSAMLRLLSPSRSPSRLPADLTYDSYDLPPSSIIYHPNGCRTYLDTSNLSLRCLASLKAQEQKIVQYIFSQPVVLPFDLRTFFFSYRDPTPRALRSFSKTADRLFDSLRHMEAQMRTQGVKGFPDVVLGIVTPMRQGINILKKIYKERPKELRGNFDRIQEWISDLGAAEKAVGRVMVRAAKVLEESGEEEAVKVVREIRKLRLLKMAFALQIIFEDKEEK
ncbi:Protein of unknown function [Pyronema omphalodes CBS 100304]|uniref:Uncharacterized protein n=1 Tax=Pyronema omphalodes (strain CBS 100304) TaxID=1076935 RepID=U4LJS0_PYROM|nr:Protein of unknown function [Pyronema omphalodes CBS 100304]